MNSFPAPIHPHLFTDGSCHGNRKGSDIPSAQILTFPLVAEELQLPLLLLIQGIAVSNLNTQRTAWRRLHRSRGSTDVPTQGSQLGAI